MIGGEHVVWDLEAHDPLPAEWLVHPYLAHASRTIAPAK